MPFENRQHLKPGMQERDLSDLPFYVITLKVATCLRDGASDFMIENAKI